MYKKTNSFLPLSISEQRRLRYVQMWPSLRTIFFILSPKETRTVWDEHVKKRNHTKTYAWVNLTYTVMMDGIFEWTPCTDVLGNIKKEKEKKKAQLLPDFVLSQLCTVTFVYFTDRLNREKVCKRPYQVCPSCCGPSQESEKLWWKVSAWILMSIACQPQLITSGHGGEPFQQFSWNVKPCYTLLLQSFQNKSINILKTRIYSISDVYVFFLYI